jgi:hypothetical protein
MGSSDPSHGEVGVNAISKEQFHCLYINLNSIAELALKLIASELSEAGPRDDVPADEGEPDLDALLDPAGYDLSELDRLDALAEESARAQFERGPSSPREQAAPAGAPARDEAPIAAPRVDYDHYMRRANTDDEQLCERLIRYYEKADLQAIGSLLEAVPDDLPPLTQRMAGAEIGRWVSLYRTRHEGLGDLVVEIRTLED